MNEIIRSIESAQLKSDIPAFAIGDTVRVQVKVVEGSRERLQAYHRAFGFGLGLCQKLDVCPVLVCSRKIVQEVKNAENTCRGVSSRLYVADTVQGGYGYLVKSGHKGSFLFVVRYRVC